MVTAFYETTSVSTLYHGGITMTVLSDRPPLADEKLLTISQAAKEIPSRPCSRSVWRWADSGINGIRLETIRIGAKRYTSREAISRFISKLNR